MELVMIPAKTVVHIKGLQVALPIDTLVEVAYENMSQLTGYHFGHVHDAPLTGVPVQP